MLKSNIINRLLFYTFFAGLIWYGIGEFIFILKRNNSSLIHNPLLNGMYFAFLSALSISACLFSEKKVHILVSSNFLYNIVMTHSLKKILTISFLLMFLVAGFMELIYEIEFSNIRFSLKANAIPVDYYFVLDNSASMEWNDPNDERIRILERLVNSFPDDRKIALITFGNSATIQIQPTLSSKSIKSSFERIINNLVKEPSTNIADALIKASSILQNESSRKEVIIFISDGEDANEFNELHGEYKRIMQPFITENIPIHTIFLNPDNVSSSFLSSISNITGGTYSTIRNPVDIEFSITDAMKIEEDDIVTRVYRRDLLDKRTGNKQNSVLYAIMHIVFISLIGLLIGYLIYSIFSNMNLFRPLLIGGGISGLLAGLILEFGLQFNILSAYTVRLLACVILSTVIWLIAFAYAYFIKIKYSKALFACFEEPYIEPANRFLNEDNSLQIDKKQTKSYSGVIDYKKEEGIK